MSDYQLELALAAQRSVTGPGTERAAAKFSDDVAAHRARATRNNHRFNRSDGRVSAMCRNGAV